MKWLLFLYPWLELWSLIELGARTSATTAMLWLLGAGVLGIGLFRLAGRQTLQHLQQAQREGALSQQLLMGKVARLVAGILLIVPGLISDALAVIVLIAPLRILLAKLMVMGSANGQHSHDQWQAGPSGFHTDPRNGHLEGEGVTLEGEFEPVLSDSEGTHRETTAPLEHNPTERG
tara:strand:- start:1052 stop:1579 length:528 start_codon:yes stop_codon:yes gene_type:complete